MKKVVKHKIYYLEYSGIGKQKGSRVLTIAFSAALKERRDKTCQLLKFIAAINPKSMVVAESVADVQESWARYVKAHGSRSRPASGHAVIALDDADRREVVRNNSLHERGQEAMVQPLLRFFWRQSKGRDAACPGRWS